MPPTTTSSSSGPTPSSSGSIKIRTLADRARLAEFIVEKRSKFLLYLVQLHAPRQKASAAAATPPLWMGTIRIHRAEILRHFLVPEELVREEAVMRPISTTEIPSGGPTSTILAPPLTLGSRAHTNLSRPQTGAGSSAGSPASPAVTTMPSEPYSMDASKAAGTPQYPIAEASWVREHCTRWALIGACLPGILQAPLYSPPDAFIDAFYQLLLEIDVYLEGTDTAAKLLSIRTLKGYRSDRFDRLKKSQGAAACHDASIKLSRGRGGGGGDVMATASEVQEADLQTNANGGNAPVLQMMTRRYECQSHAATRGILRHVRSKATGHTLPYPEGCQPDVGSAAPSVSVVEMVEEEQHQAYNQKVIDAMMGGTADNAIPLAAFHSSLPQRKHVLLAMGLGAGGLPPPAFSGGGGGGMGVNSSKAEGDATKAAGEEWDKALEGVEGSYLESKGSFKYHFLDVEVAKSILGGGGGPSSSSSGGSGGGGPDSSPKRPPKKDGGGEGGHSDPWADMPSASGKGPSYDVVTPALCKVLTTAYNKLADYTALEEPHAIETILAIDKRLKHDFFGALSRQLGALAQAKLKQQALYLTDGIFGSYSSAGREIGAWLPQGEGGMGGLLMGDEDED